MEFVVKNPRDKAAIELIAQHIKNTQWEGKVYLCGDYVRNTLAGIPTTHIELCVTSPSGHEVFGTWICKAVGCYEINKNPVVFPKIGTSFFGFKNINNLNTLRIKCCQAQSKLFEVKCGTEEKTCYTTLNGDSFDKTLTIDALYVDICTMKIEDPTGRGLQDMQDKLIRMRGDSTYAFRTVPIRMMKVIYTSGLLGWGIDSRTWMNIIKGAHHISNAKMKYVTDEMTKILLLEKPSVALKKLLHCGILKKIMPVVHRMVGCTQGQSHYGDVFEHTLDVIDKTSSDFITRWAAFLHDIGKPMVKQVINGRPTFTNHDVAGSAFVYPYLESIGMDEQSAQHISKIIGEHMRFKKNGLKAKPSNKSIKKFVASFGDTCVNGIANMTRALEIMHADNLSHAEGARREDLIPYVAEKIIEFKEEEKKELVDGPKMPLSGADIIEWFDLKPSPEVGLLLKRAQEIFANNTELTRNELLLALGKTDLVPKRV